jgi:hypothetical protein
MLVGRLLRIVSTIILAILVIILIAVVSLFVYEPSPTEGFAFSSAGKTIQLSDGRSLAYLDSGNPEGRPVFYFHGGPGSRLEGYLYNELNQQLGIRMIAIDRPGYGLSDFQEDRTYLDWPDDVSELANQLGIDRLSWLERPHMQATITPKVCLLAPPSAVPGSISCSSGAQIMARG